MTRGVREPVRSHLADGREILFFTSGGAPAIGVDHRDLPARPTVPATTIRRDPTTGDSVIVAPARQERTYKPPRAMCPLCPDPAGLSSEIPAGDYEVVVFENRFPSLATPPGFEGEPGGSADPLRVEGPGVGRCEVVCFTSDHDGSFAGLSQAGARLVLDAWSHRTADLLARSDIEEVYCFENRGEEIGVTLPHPHGQIYGYPFRTRRTAALLRTAAGRRSAPPRACRSRARRRSRRPASRRSTSPPGDRASSSSDRDRAVRTRGAARACACASARGIRSIPRASRR